MATIQRPIKTYGTRKYVSEVAAAPSNYAPILSNEVDDDIDLLFAAWNGGADTVNLKDGSVTTPKLADAPNGVVTSKVNDLAITTPKLADKAVTKAKMGTDVSGLVVADYGTLGGLGSNTTAFVTLLDMTTTALLQNRRYRLLFDGFYNKAVACNLVFTVNVGATPVLYGALSPSSIAVDSAMYLADLQFLWNGGTIYIRGMVAVSADMPGGVNTSGLGRMLLKSAYFGTTATSWGPLVQILFDAAHASNGVARYQATLELL
jgi:hypothetical protein